MYNEFTAAKWSDNKMEYAGQVEETAWNRLAIDKWIVFSVKEHTALIDIYRAIPVYSIHKLDTELQKCRWTNVIKLSLYTASDMIGFSWGPLENAGT